MKSIYDVVAETTVKYMDDRKIVLLERQDDIYNALRRNGISNDNVVIVDDFQENIIEKLKANKQRFYLVVGRQSRNDKTKKLLESIGYKEINDYMFVNGIQRFITQEMYVDVNKTDVMNIVGFTSFGRMPFVLPLLQMLQDKHPGKRIRYYLLYHASAVPESVERFKRIARCARRYKNIEFHGIPVGDEDEKIRELLDKYIGLSGMGSQISFNTGGGSYYALLLHKYLPESLDRVLGMDTGDIIINDNLEPFYYEDFEDNLLIVTIGFQTKARDSKGRLRPYCVQDCDNPEYLLKIAQESFNGGVKLFNLEKMRQLDYSMDDYLSYAKKLQEKYQLGPRLFYDQGLLGFMFMERMKFYKIKEFNDENFMPFNHVVFNFLNHDGSMMDTYYEPSLVHFCGSSIRPWNVKYPQRLKQYQEGEQLCSGNKNAENYYWQWYDAALKAEKIVDTEDNNYNPRNLYDIYDIYSFAEYVHYIKFFANNFLVCISIMDSAGGGIPDHMAEKLTEIGLADLRQRGRWSYVFVQAKGKILLNKLDGFETITEESIVYENHTIELSSKPFNRGSSVKIMIDGKDYAVNRRGLNIVVYDLDNERLVDTVDFDTCFMHNPCYRKSDLYYAVNGYSSRAQDFHGIVSLLSNRTYEDIMGECKSIIGKVEDCNAAAVEKEIK